MLIFSKMADDMQLSDDDNPLIAGNNNQRVNNANPMNNANPVNNANHVNIATNSQQQNINFNLLGQSQFQRNVRQRVVRSDRNEPISQLGRDHPAWRFTNSIKLSELEEPNWDIDLNNKCLDIQLLRIIVPKSDQKAKIFNYSKGKRTEQEVNFTRLFMCRVYNPTCLDEQSSLVYIMESSKRNNNLFNFNIDQRDNGTITIGSFLKILSPHVIEERMHGDIPIIVTSFPLVAMTRPQRLATIPINPQIEGNHTMAFVFNNKQIGIQQTSVYATKCKGFFCDKQRVRELNDKKACGCYGQPPNESNIIFSHRIFFDHENEKFFHPDFSSMKFSQFYLNKRIPSTTTTTDLSMTTPFIAILQCIKDVLELVNDNGGWTIVGWYKRGLIRDNQLIGGDSSSDDTIDGRLTFHFVEIVPTNIEFMEKDTDLYRDLQDKK